MKNKFTRILSFLILASLMLSCFAVFGFAAEADAETNDDSLKLVINRTFDEGWDYDNGFYTGEMKNQKAEIDYEQSVDFEYNYFTRFTVTHDEKSGSDGYVQYNFGLGQPLNGAGVVEFDIKTDNVCDVGSLGYFMTSTAADKREIVHMFSINDNKLIINFNDGGVHKENPPFAIADFSKELKDQWIHVATVISFEQNLRRCDLCDELFDLNETKKCLGNECENASSHSVLKIRCYFGAKDIYDWENALSADENTVIDTSANTYYTDLTYTLSRDAMPASIAAVRMGFLEYKENRMGMSYCVDNFLVYYDSAPMDEDGNPAMMTPVNGIDNVDKYGYGESVNETKTKTIQLLTGVGGEDYVKSGIVMKVGSDYMLNKKERQPIFTNSTTGKVYGAPIKVNGQIYVPLEIILGVTGYPIYIHEDGISYDISTESGTSLLALGRKSAVVNGEKIDLKAAPMMASDPEDETNTYPVIAMEDVEKFFQGYYVTYDEMGLIVISRGQNVLDRSSDLSEMLDLMTSFIYDFSTTDELLEMMKENTNNFDHPYLIVTDESLSYMRDVYNGVIDDPLYKGWLDEYVDDTEGYFKRFTTLPTNPANPDYTKKACDTKSDKYKLLATELTNPFSGIKEGELWTDKTEYMYAKTVKTVVDGEEVIYYYPSKLGDLDNGEHYNAGYDYDSSESRQLSTYSQYIQQFALAYLITGNEDYASLAYDMVISLCDKDNWYDWSHAYFLAVGETMIHLGLAYDWLYDEWAEIQHNRADKYSLDYITQTIYDRVYFHSYETSRYNKITDVWVRRTEDEGYFGGAKSNIWNWSKTEINWNCVCNSGLVVGAMAIVGESGGNVDFTYYEDGVNAVEWTLTNNFWRIAEYGLAQYAPDGSYIESPGYWSYATTYLSILLATIPGVYGDDLGFYETWGFDKTFYFAIQVEFPYMKENGRLSHKMWKYNDCNSNDGQDTQSFLVAADFLNDLSLAAIRIDKIGTGDASFIDILKYKPEYANLTMADVELELDWRLESLEGVVARSTWDGFSTYCGIMGNHNNQVQHDQVDSGNFIYTSQGYSWIIDLGADEYSVYEYWGDGIRERYYRNSAEGHNTVVITSLQDPNQKEYMPYGQSLNGGGVVSEYVSGGEAGMYAVIDNSGAYGNITNYARRGMLFTNNRETVVIQDEIAFKGVQSCAWVAHTEGNVFIQNYGKTAYITQTLGDGKTYCIRLTLVSDNSRLKFETMNCGTSANDFLMDGANRPGYSESHGGVSELSRTHLKRLVIKGENSLVFNCAVVIENVASLGDDSPVQYEYKQISKWTIDESFVPGDSEEESGGNTVTPAQMTDIKTYTAQAAKLLESNYALTTRTVDFFKNLVRVTIAVNTFRPETFKNIPQINNAYLEYLEQIKYYEAYKADVNSTAAITSSFGSSLVYAK